MIWRLWVQTPLGAIFDKIYFVLCNFRSVRQSDRNAYREKLDRTFRIFNLLSHEETLSGEVSLKFQELRHLCKQGKYFPKENSGVH